MRLQDLTLHDRDSVYHMPRGADWLWLTLFALVVLGSGAYVWAQLGLESVVGRDVFFAAVLLSILWAALIYTLKLSASVIVGPRGLALVRGPWRTELTWAEVAQVGERSKTSGGQRFRWFIAYSYDTRELHIREDMLEDYARFRAEATARYQLWQEHGGTWGATGGGPFAAEEEVAGLIAWWLAAAGACLLPGLYFALLIAETFVLGIALIALATICSLFALRISLGRKVYTVDRRAVVARRTVGTTQLPWSEITKVERARSRAWVPARIGIILIRLGLALAARADGRVESFTWTPRAPEYLVLRAVGGRRIRVRLHRLARPDELLAWVEFYDRVAREAQRSGKRASEPLAPQAAPALPDLGSATGPADPWAARRGGEPAPAAAGSPSRATSAPAGPAPSAPPPAQPKGPRVTRVLGRSDVENIDPRILAVLKDVAASEPGRPAPLPPEPETERGIEQGIEQGIERGGESDWLNATMNQPLFPPSGGTTKRDGSS
jgi:hypothetical protein